MDIKGKPVINGQRPFELMITRHDIQKGKAHTPGGCAAAVALLRQDKQITQARVHVGRIFIEGPSAWIRYQTPHTLRDEIVAFDRGGSFLPGKHLVLPLTKSAQRYLDDKEWRKVERDKRKEGSKDKRKKRVLRHIVSGVRPRGANR